MNPHLTSSQTVLQVIDGELQRTSTVSDVKYQDITYYMQNPNKVIDSKMNIPIDFLKATSEMGDLDWNYEWNYIGFVNNKKKRMCSIYSSRGNQMVCRSSNQKWQRVGRLCMVCLFRFKNNNRHATFIF